jgi:uncharacterized protein (TIGR00725 family)
MPVKVVAVFGSSITAHDTPEWEEAERVGRRCAEAGLTVLTGGYGGSMEAISKGAAEVNGHVIGVTAPDLFHGRGGANPYVAEVIEATDLPNRLGIITHLADGAIVLPGSIGTATELVLAWNINHIVRRNGGTRMPVVAVGDAWRRVIGALSDVIHANPADVQVTATSDDAVDWLLSQPEIR